MKSLPPADSSSAAVPAPDAAPGISTLRLRRFFAGITPNNFRVSAPFLVGALLLLCALTFYYFAVLKIDYEKTALLDFDPHTDAEEYFTQAKAMLKDGWQSVRIGYDKLPRDTR